jgi:DNA repair protein RecO (recombination protein O)
MFVHYRTSGFILKKTDRGEFDELLTIYTEDFGKLEILAKAIRKISSKLRAGAEIFYLSEVEFIQGKVYKTLTDAVVIEKFENLRNSLKALRIAFKISEPLNNLVRGQEIDKNIWNLLNETFQRLNDRQIAALPNCQLLYYYFIWNFLSILGYQPDLYNCVLCHNKLTPDRLFFSSKEGGTICQKCGKLLKLGKEIDLETMKILRIIFKKNWAFLSKLKIEKSNLKSLDKITNQYYSYILSELAIL